MIKNEDGFTLLELLTALAIAGVVAAISVPTFINIQNQQLASKLTSEQSNTASIESGLCEIASKPDHTC